MTAPRGSRARCRWMAARGQLGGPTMRALITLTCLLMTVGVAFIAGRGGVAMIQVFKHYDWLRLTGVADIDGRALGMELARTMEIPTYDSAEDVVRLRGSVQPENTLARMGAENRRADRGAGFSGRHGTLMGLRHRA